MKKIISLLTSLVIFGLCLCIQVPISAEDDPLSMYKERLLELNNEYGTNFVIPNQTAMGGDYSEIVAIYSKMTLEEFDNYILSIIDGSIYSSNDETVHISDDNNDEIMPTATAITQRYYYSGSTTKYLWVRLNREYADGYDRYTSFLNSGYHVDDGAYPAYVPYSRTYSYSNGYRNFNITFNCNRYYSKTLSDGTLWSIPVTFYATGGNVYGSVSL